MKPCTVCKENKALTCFSKRTATRDGVHSQCKECCKTKRRAKTAPKRKEQQDKIKALTKKCNKCEVKLCKSHFGYRKGASDGLHGSCKVCLAKYKKNWAKDNPQNTEHRKRWAREYKAKRKAKDPLFKLRYSLSAKICTVLGKKGYSKTSKTADIIGADFNTVWNHLRKTWYDKYGRELEDTDKYDIHHITYCSTAKNEEELIKLQHYTNLTLLTPSDHQELHRNFK